MKVRKGHSNHGRLVKTKAKIWRLVPFRTSLACTSEFHDQLTSTRHLYGISSTNWRSGTAKSGLALIAEIGTFKIPPFDLFFFLLFTYKIVHAPKRQCRSPKKKSFFSGDWSLAFCQRLTVGLFNWCFLRYGWCGDRLEDFIKNWPRILLAVTRVVSEESNISHIFHISLFCFGVIGYEIHGWLVHEPWKNTKLLNALQMRTHILF